jgi:3-(3-hydroxy-phenyl)propionate hydroxylase
VVVGAGPVGLATALGLARRGVQVTVLEAARSVSFGSRAICVSRHSLEILDRLGAGKQIADASLAWTGGRSFYRGQEVLMFQMPVREHDVRPPMVNISQGVLEQVLVDALESTPGARIRWGMHVTGCRTEDDRAVLTVRTEAGDQELAAQWVVAADGAASGIRRHLGLRMAGTSYQAQYVIADIYWPAPLPTERRVWFDSPSHPGATVLMHRQPNDIWRIDYQLQSNEDAEFESRPERVRERIAEHLAWLGHEVDWTLEWTSLYRAHALSLERYVHGRVVFAGDAAHLVPIFGVRGLNSGLEDADTLAWQLAAVIRATADPTLLESYSKERRQAWLRNVEAAGKSTRFMSPTGSGAVLTRDAVLALAVHEPEFGALVDPRQSTASDARCSQITWPIPDVAGADGGVQPGDPITDQLVEVALEDGHRRSALLAELGSGFGVIGFARPPVGGAASAPARRQPGAVPEKAAGERMTDVVADLVSHLSTALAPEAVRGVVFGSGSEHGPATALDEPGTLRPLCPTELTGDSGDIVVVRPDGLVLCRVPRASRRLLAELPERLATGTAPVVDPAHLSIDQIEPHGGSGLEQVWDSLSEALDNVQDREGWLTRLALGLGGRCEPTAWRAAVSAADRPSRLRDPIPSDDGH